MDRRALVLLGSLVVAQATTEEFKGKADLPTPPPVGMEPRGGVWAAPPGESGASRHAPRPGPGDVPPADVAEEVNKIEIDPKGVGANP